VPPVRVAASTHVEARLAQLLWDIYLHTREVLPAEGHAAAFEQLFNEQQVHHLFGQYAREWWDDRRENRPNPIAMITEFEELLEMLRAMPGGRAAHSERMRYFYGLVEYWTHTLQALWHTG
jgi:hypothetical protein